MSGRDLFTYKQDLFVDDESAADDTAYVRDETVVSFMPLRARFGMKVGGGANVRCPISFVPFLGTGRTRIAFPGRSEFHPVSRMLCARFFYSHG